MEFQRKIKVIFTPEEMNKFSDFWDLTIKMLQNLKDNEDLREVLHNIGKDMENLYDYIED